MKKSLIVGAGKHYKKHDCDVTLDIRPFPNIDVICDLNYQPWPFQACEFSYIYAIHVVEHICSLIAFMDEAHRILNRGGELHIETPNAGVNPDLEFCDPTHVRCYRPYTFYNYFTPEGIAKFGYTDKAWKILSMETPQLEVPNDIIKVVLTPLK